MRKTDRLVGRISAKDVFVQSVRVMSALVKKVTAPAQKTFEGDVL